MKVWGRYLYPVFTPRDALGVHDTTVLGMFRACIYYEIIFVLCYVPHHRLNQPLLPLDPCWKVFPCFVRYHPNVPYPDNLCPNNTVVPRGAACLAHDGLELVFRPMYSGNNLSSSFHRRFVYLRWRTLCACCDMPRAHSVYLYIGILRAEFPCKP